MRRPRPKKMQEAHTVRLTAHVMVPPMTQVPVEVDSRASGLAFLEPRLALQDVKQVRMANGIIEATPEKRFRVLLSNFSRHPRRFPKGTVLGYGTRNPISIVTPNREVATQCGGVLHINTLEHCGTHEYEISNPTWTDTRSPSPPLEVTALAAAAPYPRKAEPPLPEAVPDWRNAVNLEHVGDPEMRNRIMNMLDRHSNMWDGSLGEIKATSHRLAPEPGARPHREIPRRTGPSMRKRIAEEIQKMLHAGVVEPATSEWASPVVLLSKKDGSLRFCVDYRRLNAKNLTDAYPLPRINDCIESLGDAVVFTTLDCNSGYWQVPVAQEDQDKTTFTTH